MHTTGRPYGSFIAALGAVGIARELAGAPWWLAAAGFGCFALGLAVFALRSVFPQESAHRLAWWRDHRRHRQQPGTPADD